MCFRHEYQSIFFIKYIIIYYLLQAKRTGYFQNYLYHYYPLEIQEETTLNPSFCSCAIEEINGL